MAPRSPVTERFTVRSGVRIRFLDNDPVHPVGLPVLFSPGFTDFADEYLDMLELMSPRRLLVVEVRGRGGSETPIDGYAAADHRDDLRAALDEVGIDRFHLMTFSRGTTWALDLLLAEPGRVQTVSIGDYWAAEHRVEPELVDRVLSGRFRGRPMSERISSGAARSVLAAAVNRDLSGDLAATGVPVLVATGTEVGCLLNVDAITHLRSRLQDLREVVIEGAAHDLFRPDRSTYPQAVLDFIEQVAPGT
ncbi:MAG: hypothetical protein RLZZ623_3592 [Actinomycetota bacterium]|jgi:pimeloyl-ACP methyl ester carboxylesterase